MIVEATRESVHQPPNSFRPQSRSFRAEFLTVAIADLQELFASCVEIRQIAARIQELFWG
jgi:hypothetical protein